MCLNAGWLVHLLHSVAQIHETCGWSDRVALQAGERVLWWFGMRLIECSPGCRRVQICTPTVMGMVAMIVRLAAALDRLVVLAA